MRRYRKFPRGVQLSASALRRQVNEKHKKTGQICLPEKPSVSDLESSSLAGSFAFIRSNLCTRHIQSQLTPRGHHDWPNKRANRRCGCPQNAAIRSDLSIISN
jgi:hypothetical protein